MPVKKDELSRIEEVESLLIEADAELRAAKKLIQKTSTHADLVTALFTIDKNKMKDLKTALRKFLGKDK